MRCVLLLPCLFACATDTTSQGPPDACSSLVGAFQIASPKQNQTYLPTMDLYVNESERWAAYDVSMIEETGRSYAWVSDGTMVNPDPLWWSLDNFHYYLAPGHRYTATISTCDEMQSVTFFTASP